MGLAAPIRLRIADDNAEFRLSAARMVSLESDIEVVSLAGDGQEALDRARRHQPDVAVIDVHMPRVDGLTAIRSLASISPGTVCLAMSYDGERDGLRQAVAAGAREYLIKPFNGDELASALRRVARRGPATAEQRASGQALMRQALAYLRDGREDAEAARVYRELAQVPGLDANTLTRLAEVFLARRHWHVLRLICERLEQLPAP